MKKNKYLIVLLLIFIIYPSVVFASWWNPLSWKFFGFLHKKDVISQKVVNQSDSSEQIKELQKQIDELKKIQQGESNNTDKALISEEARIQIEKDLRAKIEKESLSLKDKTLSEQLGVSKDKMSACIKATDSNSLQSKINLSVENAMKALPQEERGTPYSVIVGKNGVMTEIRGALPYEEIKKAINEVVSGTVTNKYAGEISVSEPGDHLMGSINAQVKIIEYSDLECPYCKIYHETLKRIVADSSGGVSWVYRHWPIHQNSFEKLVASECVSKIKGNDAFWKYIDLLFGMLNQQNPSISDKL